MGRPRSCMICDHPERDKIDAMLAAGISQEDIRAHFGSTFTLATLHKHDQHRSSDLNPIAAEAHEEALKVLSAMSPDDMLTHGRLELQKLMARLQVLHKHTLSTRVSDQYLKALDLWIELATNERRDERSQAFRRAHF